MRRPTIGREISSHVSIETCAVNAIDANAIAIERDEKLTLRQLAFQNEFPRQFKDIGEVIAQSFSYAEMRVLLRCIREYGNAKYIAGIDDTYAEWRKIREKLAA